MSSSTGATTRAAIRFDLEKIAKKINAGYMKNSDSFRPYGQKKMNFNEAQVVRFPSTAP